MDHVAQRGQLAWRCRRGMKELDLLLVAYLDQHWGTSTSSERDAFARLLELPDPELAAYLLGHAEAADTTLAPVLGVLRGLAAQRTVGGPRPASQSGAR